MNLPRVNHNDTRAISQLQPVRILTQRTDYDTCHISVPDESGRLPAIALAGRFYSFFRSLHDPNQVIGMLLKLSSRGEQMALTLINQGYVLWANEPEAKPAPPTQEGQIRLFTPTFEPSACWVISSRQAGYRPCSLTVPDLSSTLPGLIREPDCFYSLYRREQDAGKILKLATRLIQRGDEIVLLVGKMRYIICIREPNATLAR